MAAPEPSKTTSPPAPPTGGAKPESAPSMGALLKALRRRWLLASSLAILAAAAVGSAVWFFLPPPPFEANAVLHVSSVRLVPTETRTSAQGEFTIYQQGQKALLTSRLVINAALRESRVSELSLIREQSDPISFLQRELKVDFKSGPEYMRLSLKGNRPEDQRILVEAVVRTYLKEYADREHNKLANHRDQLKEILNNYSVTLQRKRRMLRDMTPVVGSGDPLVAATKQRFAAEALGQAERERLKLKSDLARAHLEVAAHRARDGKIADWKVPDSVVELELQKDPILLQLIAKKTTLENRLAELLPKYTDGRNSPALKPVVQDVDNAQAAVDARRDTLRPQIATRLREQASRDLKTTLAQAEERESFLKDLDAELARDVESYRKQGETLHVGQLDLENYRQEISQLEKIFEQVSNRSETLKLELDAPPRVTLVEEAYVTQDEPLKRQVKAAGFSGLGAMLLVLGLVSWREYRLRRIDAAAELSHEIGLPTIGTVPVIPDSGAAARACINAYREMRGPVVECIDGTRTRLVHATGTHGIRVVMVTSAVPREGKTSLAGHLAASLARAGHRTLLIDGDLRLPSLDRVFNVPAAPGVAEVLRTEAHVSAAIRSTPIARLWFMPAGNPDLRAIQALSQPRLRGMIDRLRPDYDYIIVDSAPILPVVDSLLIGQHVDGVIISVLREVSQVPVVRTACDRLTELNIRLLGAVLSGVDLDNTHSGKYGPSYAPAAPTLGLPAEVIDVA